MFRKSNWRTHRKEACILMKVEKIALNLWVYQQLNFFQNCNCVSFSPVPTAAPTKSVINEGQTIATVHPQPQPDDETIIHLHIVLLGTVMELSEYLIWVKWKWL